MIFCSLVPRNDVFEGPGFSFLDGCVAVVRFVVDVVVDVVVEGFDEEDAVCWESAAGSYGWAAADRLGLLSTSRSVFSEGLSLLLP